MYMPVHSRDQRHDDGTGWRGFIALLALTSVIAAGHAAANARHAGTLAGKDLPGRLVTGSFSC
jgi:hypothetical protein